MWWELEKDIRASATKKIREHERYRKRVIDEGARRLRRSTGSPSLSAPNRPTTWDANPAFDPYHVRARAKSISHSITQRLRSGAYSPLDPINFSVPKPDGGKRLVTSFAIADEVISSRLYRSLLDKNRPLLSARSYAYRDDIGVNDAIAHIQSEWRSEHRVFVAEYDFTNFFDSISHDHIWSTLESLGIVMTSLERVLIRAFLEASTSSGHGGSTLRRSGVPLGTSVSLFLANVAASPLDRALERLGVGFVRYADDTVIWSRDYAAICRAVDELHRVSANIGSPINQSKSNGVRLLVSPSTERAEINFTSEVEYLGHALGLQSIRMRDRAEAQVRRHITGLLFNNLLREPKAGTQDWTRVGRLDRDYVTYIWQLRRYLYGHLTENEVRRVNRGAPPPRNLTGVLSRFPLINDDPSLRELDRWITTQTLLALRKRAALLTRTLTFGSPPVPWTMTRERLIDLTTKSARTGDTIDLRMPSALRMASVVRRAVRTHGTRVVGSATPLYGDTSL
ncbi:reverse transcriptase domain-containing protein [Blastococcus haudaquaticus]|uniref:Retron-type reverse transcriptase n=1 Tax=Blastococcus haudaquaticus TaxID=1938745 RepID=A0A286H8Z9_9ACTN|nr:Retron-type reverse transcriptase [Blastococcus haudaquaticus]